MSVIQTIESTEKPSARNTKPRAFLMLQGPHGPFFDKLGRILRSAEIPVWRVGFNAGDEYFWSDMSHYLKFAKPLENWPEYLAKTASEKKITDIVLYGDMRPIHQAAVELAERQNLRLHVFEEGYLRPYWITYERDGANGNSKLREISIDDMAKGLRESDHEVRRPPAHWGDVQHHKFYGALYHFMVLRHAKRYQNFKSHRAISVWKEFRLNFRRLLLTSYIAGEFRYRWRQIQLAGWPYSLVLMQLEHDANFLGHSPYSTNAGFIEDVLSAFAESAPRHHHLIFKAHPLEDGRSQSSEAIERVAKKYKISDRVHYLRGGKLAPLMAQARSAVTVNSTAAQQALWRGLPVKALGKSVYDKPSLVSTQSLQNFFVKPDRPDAARYKIYRSYLLQTSQVPGGYYSNRGRSHALRLVSDMILDAHDPYETLARGESIYRNQMGDDQE